MKEKEILERVKVLFKAFIDMYEAQDKTPYVIGIQESVAIWDEVECDANCLKEEMEDMILQIDELLEQIPKWHLVANGDLPKERDSMFKKFKGTDKWNSSMFEKISDEVLIIIRGKDSYVTANGHTVDGKWRSDYIRLFQNCEVIAWMELPKFEGRWSKCYISV